MKKKTKVGAISLPHFTTFCSYNNQDSAVLGEGKTHRSMEQTENSEINSHKYAQMTPDKSAKQLSGRKTGISTHGAGVTG